MTVAAQLEWAGTGISSGRKSSIAASVKEDFAMQGHLQTVLKDAPDVYEG